MGSKATLRLRRPGIRAIQTIDIVRGRILPASAFDTASLPDGVGRLVVRAFPKGIADSVRLGVEALRAAGAHSLVLDLRGAVGGDLAQGASIADLFLDSGAIIALTRSRKPADSVSFRDSTASPFDSLPIAVLVDEGTAGAAEVVAGALQDHDRAAVLGAISFGRGVTQSAFPVGTGASLRLTTALWLTPRGRQIQRPPRSADGDSVPRPKLKSDAGRSLLGGGGIVPDRMISPAGAGDSVLALARSILVRGGIDPCRPRAGDLRADSDPGIWRRMKIFSLAVFATLLAAPLAAQRTRTVVVVPGQLTTIVTDTMGTLYDVPFSTGRTYAALLSAFSDLKLPAEVKDSSVGRVETNVFYRRGDLAGKQISTYLNCGDGVSGPYADEDRVYMVAMVTIAPKGTERLYDPDHFSRGSGGGGGRRASDDGLPKHRPAGDPVAQAGPAEGGGRYLTAGEATGPRSGLRGAP